MFYFMSVHIEVILEEKTKTKHTLQQQPKTPIYFYIKYQLTHRTIKSYPRQSLFYRLSLICSLASEHIKHKDRTPQTSSKTLTTAGQS